MPERKKTQLEMLRNIMTKSGNAMKKLWTSKNLCTLSDVFFSKHPYKPKTREVIHPYITPPEYLRPSDCFEARTSGLQQYIPCNYYRTKWIESLRSGEYLGEDYPWNLLPKWKYWKKRKYNVRYHEIPWFISKVKGVSYYERLNVWMVQWVENGVHRIRRFRCAFGILQAKLAAEQFRRNLEESGRVDNRKSERQIRMDYIQKKDERILRKKKYSKISKGQF
ncbi:transcription factor with AP2 domain(s), putative [Plasmodium ovale wallikeri]|uniref:Transcription factor with AP2 domain(S), putative n=2 Tax=Plasmodium ovale TaxID=36330 RepID=A0A1A8YV11_PLAOA|nr:transcription factor with AP2 domain(s), putative [Plasmodium ovale wallikeri]SBT35510.1 transcription factor with AP2 domain(s), putative [Plasmodium ovale wallikeri]SBT76537.1 transcription factor with AP2 domain(s), putative [Plasmodium ovale]